MDISSSREPADMILVAQPRTLNRDYNQVLIATTNVPHLALFAPARLWRDIAADIA
jgi:hypothetical protein